MTDLDDAIEAIFADDGPLARRLPGYRARRAQIEMALQVARTLRTRRGRLVVEAGTGTGKSFAYLVPALLSGLRVVVATGTKALQDQLFDKDAPVAVAAVAEHTGAQDLHVVRMKGRQNYLCLLKLAQRTAQGSFGFAADDTLVQIGRFARETKTGDRAELVGLPEQLPTWSELDAAAETCVGMQCPVYDDCFVVKMRRSAELARVIVVNHHLLCADQAIRLETGGVDNDDAVAAVIPRAEAVIVDEAHALPDVATDWFGLTLSQDAVVRLLVDVRRVADDCVADDRAALIDHTLEVEEASTALFAALQPLARGDRSTFALDDASRTHAAALGAALQGLGTSLQAARRREGEGDDDDERRMSMKGAETTGIARRTERTRAELDFVLGPAMGDPRFVVFLDVTRRGISVQAAPIDVSAPLSATLFEPDAPVVLTSATIAIGGDARSYLFRVGLGDDEGVQTSCYPSPFDYPHRAALYCPADMPEPDDAAWTSRFDDEVSFLLAQSRGGALLLFTSRRAMDEAYARLSSTLQRLGIPALRQGERPRHVLLDEMRAHPSGVALFATHSFWEGVDVRGKALRLVVIDRLPFAVPSDPLVRARGDHARAEGRDPFADVAVPEAALALKQGVGRLLRSVDDAGIVAMLDGRLRRRRYGRVFLDALPPLTRIGARPALSSFWTRFVAPALGLTDDASTPPLA